MQCLMQKKRSVFNFILSNYILASVLITTTNHITTRNSYRYPRARCLFSLQVPSSARKGTLVTFEIKTSYFLKLEVAYSTLFVAQMLLILFSIRTRRMVSLQILWPSQFTQTWPKRCRVRRHFDEGSCRYPRTLYHCALATNSPAPGPRPLTYGVSSECLGTRSYETTSRDQRGKIQMFFSSTGACTAAKFPIANHRSQINTQLYSASLIRLIWQQRHSDSEFDAL